MSTSPPSYELVRQPDFEDSPPEYGAAISSIHADIPITSEHKVSLKHPDGREGLTLVVRSRAQDGKYLPLFFDGDAIAGEVRVNFEKAESLKGATIRVTGVVMSVGTMDLTFLDLVEPLWSPEGQGPLQGEHTWPFSIKLPADTPLALNPKSTPERYSLPPSISDRASPVQVRYKLAVNVRRGVLYADHDLYTSFVYLPRSIAEPPSVMRRVAYQEMTPLLGPEEDPQGWKVLHPLGIEGTLSKKRSVSVQCDFAVAIPLSYGSGSPIPLKVTLRGADAEALDLLAPALKVQLRRTITTGSEHASQRSDKTFVNTVAQAVFWPESEATTGAGTSGTKVMWGELYVPKGITATFSFFKLAIKYDLVVLPPQIPGFASSAKSKEPLLSEPIVVTLANARGVHSRSYVPPGYVVPEPEEDWQSTAYAFLETGKYRYSGRSD
ncbi:hypothetical protein FA95DRAFT_1601919 [Auriscalpium vulgare]|uniref:Uncharacterized protein n=1 Tax=Auriscalpium vulgare TaxID=40419 RepID=A0ACB8S7S5_9AGAM|nr:hypothetical protein FA95DRAFT_1601919 [Auriscalpium vulgare]